MSKKAILVTSFGTSFNETREKTIDAIEKQIADEFPDWEVRRAWTSRMIIGRSRSATGPASTTSPRPWTSCPPRGSRRSSYSPPTS